MQGYIQVYTGDGKGKTTAALGLALRAAGHGLRVFFGQFMKARATGEVKAIRERLPEITLRQFGRGHFVRGQPTPADIRAARRGLDELRAALRSGRYALVIADEANVAVRAGLFAPADLLQLADEKPPQVELVFTGRGAPAALRRRADLVTEMQARKHYFARGVRARRGIEE